MHKGGDQAREENRSGNRHAGHDIATATEMWQTPNLPNGGGKTRGGGRSDELLLEGQAPAVTLGLWQTATVQDAHGHGYVYQRGDHNQPFLTLTGQAQELWPTPDTGESLTGHGRRGGGR